MATSIDEQFIAFVVKSLVGNPDAVTIERRIDEKGVLLELTVDPEDLGRVIGKRGATAQSLRTLLRALGTKNDARYNLKIIDNGVGEYSRDNNTNDDNSAPVNDTSVVEDSVDDEVSGVASLDDSDNNDENTTLAEVNNDEIDDDSDADTTVEAEAVTSDRLTQTRRELEELDDLDV
jgi:predicted RNA-binding protein YlqC (UPF0109 family)